MLNQILDDCVIFNQCDPHIVSEYVNQHIGHHKISILDKDQPKASLWHRDLSELALSRISYGGNVRVISPDLDEIYHIQIVLSGQCYYKNQALNQEVMLEAGQLLLLNPNDKVDLRYSKDCEKVIIKIPRHIIYDAAAEFSDSIPKQGIKFECISHETTQLPSLTQLLELVCLEAESLDVQNMLAHSYEKLLAYKLLNLCSNNLKFPQQGENSHSYFDKIDEFIVLNIKENISIEHLALQYKISHRTLYNMFSKYKGVSPKCYIKQKKLLAVKKKLSSDSATARNVTEVALDYGFMHLGRFSCDYKKTFGELPSETLKRKNSA